MAPTDFIVILSTCGSKTEAETIASRLVSDRAAACVNIIENVTSVYQWQGKIETGTECLHGSAEYLNWITDVTKDK
jgi:periplasmic divalent cation tolerance protein